MSHTCTICKKNYKTWGSLNTHNYRYHNDKQTIFKCDNCPKTFTKKYSLDRHLVTCSNNNNDHQCKYCDAQFNRKDNLIRHLKTCSEGPNKDIFDKLKLNIMDIISSYSNSDDMKNEIDNLDYEKLVLENAQNQNSNNNTNQIHSNNTNSNNTTNNLNNSNNTQNNTQNNTSNIHINLVSLGNENLSETLSKEEQIAILKKRCKSLEELIKYVHFNDKYPQFQNIYIKNIKGNDVMIYDDETKDFKMSNRTEEINKLIGERMDDISDFYKENSSELNPLLNQDINDFIERVCYDAEYCPNNDTLKEARHNVKNILYNGKEQVQNNFKKMKLIAKDKKKQLKPKSKNK